jgi:hypothetical protein
VDRLRQKIVKIMEKLGKYEVKLFPVAASGTSPTPSYATWLR